MVDFAVAVTGLRSRLYRKEMRQFACADYLCDVLYIIDMEETATSKSNEMDACRYHEHGKGERYKSKYKMGLD